MSFLTPIVTVDVVLLMAQKEGLFVRVLQRTEPPYAGKLALPGGYVHPEEDASMEGAVSRVLQQKVGWAGAHLEQLASFSGPDRDPRGWSVSLAYLALIPTESLAEHPEQRWLSVDDPAVQDLAFDHGAIVEAAVQRVRNKATYSSLPTFLLDSPFTLYDVHAVYCQVLGQTLDAAAFRRKMLAQEIIEPVPGHLKTRQGAGRPAQLYRRTQEDVHALEGRFLPHTHKRAKMG